MHIKAGIEGTYNLYIGKREKKKNKQTKDKEKGHQFRSKGLMIKNDLKVGGVIIKTELDLKIDNTVVITKWYLLVLSS